MPAVRHRTPAACARFLPQPLPKGSGRLCPFFCRSRCRKAPAACARFCRSRCRKAPAAAFFGRFSGAGRPAPQAFLHRALQNSRRPARPQPRLTAADAAAKEKIRENAAADLLLSPYLFVSRPRILMYKYCI